jgi:methionyl aminopeptidase
MIIRPGISTIDLDRVAELAMKRHGLQPELPGYDGFPGHVCASPNNVAAHGVPSDALLRAGDLVAVDISGSLSGWMADTAWTFGVGSLGNSAKRVRRAAWRATVAGARAARAGGRIGDIGAAIVSEARRHGCSVVREFTGHGIGRALHETPVVPHVAAAGEGDPIVPGMVLNIEPVVCLGNASVTLLADGWSYATADGSLSAQFELTVAVGADETSVLSLGGIAVDAAPNDVPPL